MSNSTKICNLGEADILNNSRTENKENSSIITDDGSNTLLFDHRSLILSSTPINTRSTSITPRSRDMNNSFSSKSMCRRLSTGLDSLEKPTLLKRSSSARPYKLKTRSASVSPPVLQHNGQVFYYEEAFNPPATTAAASQTNLIDRNRNVNNTKLVKDYMPDISSNQVKVEHAIEDGQTGGVYYASDAYGRKWIFKPQDEEGYEIVNDNKLTTKNDNIVTTTTTSILNNNDHNESKLIDTNDNDIKIPLFRGITYGDVAKKELAAYYLDHDNFAGVPKTWPMNLKVPLRSSELSRALSYKYSSLPSSPISSKKDDKDDDIDTTTKLVPEYQRKFGTLHQFKEHIASAEDIGSSLFSTFEVQKIGVLDIRLFNLDRHLGNILVSRDESGKHILTPIDHGYTLPDIRDLSDANFEWMYWKQCKEPFCKVVKDYIARLNPLQDAIILRSLDIAPPAILTCVTTTLLLQYAAKANLTLFDIANITQRKGLKDRPSILEYIVKSALEECDLIYKKYGEKMDLVNMNLPLPEHIVTTTDNRNEEIINNLAYLNVEPATITEHLSPKTSPLERSSSILDLEPSKFDLSAIDLDEHKNNVSTISIDNDHFDQKVNEMMINKANSSSSSLSSASSSSDHLNSKSNTPLNIVIDNIEENLYDNKVSDDGKLSNISPLLRASNDSGVDNELWTDWLMRYLQNVKQGIQVQVDKIVDTKNELTKDTSEIIGDLSKANIPAITPMLNASQSQNDVPNLTI